MSVKTDPQTEIGERELDNADLETALEDREKLKRQAGALNKEYREADELAKSMLAEFALTDGEIARCGRFKIEKRAIPARTVTFETKPSSRVTISSLDDED